MIASERESRGVALVGIEPANEGTISGLPDKIVEGISNPTTTGVSSSVQNWPNGSKPGSANAWSS